MSARENILNRIRFNQQQLPQNREIAIAPIVFHDVASAFQETLTSIGGAAIEIYHEDEIADYLMSILPLKTREHLIALDHQPSKQNSPHAYQDTEIAMIRGEFAVAENGAIWVTDTQMIDRALPFICVHLVLVIRKGSIVATMHDAYEKIQTSAHEFGTFIAGPSKTADIEQSLVLGAHGPKTLTCFIVR